MNRRHTIQKELILHTVRNMKNHVSADQVYEAIVKEYPAIGKGTVYRNLAILAEEGEIQHIEVPNGPDRYDYTLKEHYHVCCTKCGSISDVDMDVIPDLMAGIKNACGFQFLGYELLFKGVCPACATENK